MKPSDLAARGAAPTRRSVLSQLLLLPVAAALSACGGGGGDVLLHAGGGGAPADTAALRRPRAATPGLQAQPAQVVDAVDRGQLLTVGGLRDGGYAVVWQSIDDPSGKTWSVWVRAYGPDGQPVGGRRLLLAGTAVPEVLGFGLSALVRRDGNLVLAYVVQRNAASQGTQRLIDVRTRAYALDGTAEDEEHVAVSIVAQRLGSGHYSAALSQTQLAQWEDGDMLVAWQVFPEVPHGAEHPDFQVRRMDAQGEPDGAVVDVGGRYGAGLRLATLADGSWLAQTYSPVTPSAQQVFANIVLFDARHPLELPDVRTLPWQSFVLALPRGGAVLFGAAFGGANAAVSPYAQWFNPAGKAAGAAIALPALPGWAVALDDGSYVVSWGQRFDKHGRALGTAIPLQAFQSAAALAQGGMAVAWLQGRQVMAQRFLDV